MADQRAQLSWRDGVIPVSTQFDDPYFSLQNGLEETEHVFLRGNNLPNRFVDGFHIAELGFGSGLNLLAAWRAWELLALDSPLQFTSFEAFPMARDDMAQALKAFPVLKPWAERFLSQWSGECICEFETLKFELVIGDARETLPKWSGRVDAWFLDGFAPAKNPELWEGELMQSVADHTKDGGTAATYTAAGFVRRGLSAAGFDVERSEGFGRKRHMTKACLK